MQLPGKGKPIQFQTRSWAGNDYMTVCSQIPPRPLLTSPFLSMQVSVMKLILSKQHELPHMIFYTTKTNFNIDTARVSIEKGPPFILYKLDSKSGEAELTMKVVHFPGSVNWGQLGDARKNTKFS